MNNKIETVSISAVEYERLLRVDYEMGKLEEAGVDNWGMYGDNFDEEEEQEYIEYKFGKLGIGKI